MYRNLIIKTRWSNFPKSVYHVCVLFVYVPDTPHSTRPVLELYRNTHLVQQHFQNAEDTGVTAKMLKCKKAIVPWQKTFTKKFRCFSVRVSAVLELRERTLYDEIELQVLSEQTWKKCALMLNNMWIKTDTRATQNYGRRRKFEQPGQKKCHQW